MLVMTTPSRVSRTSTSTRAPSITFPERLGALYDLAQRSDHVFGSPLGPFRLEGRDYFLPRFVYFGPHTSTESVRLAVFAGFNRHDRVVAHALLSFIDRLARRSDIGQSLNVSFFPVVNVAALLGGMEERDLADEDWGHPRQPEIALLNQDARRCGYQGFIRVVNAVDEEPVARVRLVRSTVAQASAIELFSSEDFAGWSVTFETVDAARVRQGPLSLADDLPFPPFEVELALPADWSPCATEQALEPLLKRLIVRYRSFLAYGQHL